MQLARRLALTPQCLLLILLGFSCFRSPRESNNDTEGPVYEGKPLLAWIQQMEDLAPKKRSKAAWALGDLRPKSPEAVPPLIRGLTDEAAEVRVMSAQSLGWLGPVAKDAVPALVEYLKNDKDAANRWVAIQALGNIGPDAREAIPILLELAITETGVTRGNAVQALGQMGPEAKAAVPMLSKFLQESDEGMRSIAAVALGQIGPDAREAVPALIVTVKGGGATGSSAIRALGEIGPAARPAVPLLRQVMKDKATEPQVWPPAWVAAARALAVIDPAEARPAVPDLIALVRQYKGRPPGDVRSSLMYRAASEALQAIDSEAATKEKQSGRP